MACDLLTSCAACELLSHRYIMSTLNTSPNATGQLLGRTFGGRYRIGEQIGAGYMSLVYRCWDNEDAAIRAIKVLQPEHSQNPGLVLRFMDEARILTTLDHPNIIRVLDYGKEPDGYVYIVEEFLDGRDLLAIHSFGIRLSVDNALTILQQAGSAIHALHQLGIVHRDIKLANLFLSRLPGRRPEEPEQVRVHLIDFGFARRIIDPNRRHDSDGFAPCTPNYAAPELLRAGVASPASEQWALGVVAYALLTGHSPFDRGEGVPAMLQRILRESPRPLQDYAPEVPPTIAAAVMRALAKSPDDRFASVEEFVGTLCRQGMQTDSSDLGQVCATPRHTTQSSWRSVGMVAATLSFLTGVCLWARCSIVATPYTEPLSVSQTAGVSAQSSSSLQIPQPRRLNRHLRRLSMLSSELPRRSHRP